MLDLQYFWARIMAKLHGDEAYSKLFRSQGMRIGKNCHIYSNIITPESYLIAVGDNVTISNDVQFITHDNCVCKLFPDKTDIFGRVQVGDNCFVGARSILMYGVSLPNNTIVAAGSVVTRSFTDEGTIIGGNPARVIGKWERFGEKILTYALNTDGLSQEAKKALVLNSPKIVR